MKNLKKSLGLLLLMLTFLSALVVGCQGNRQADLTQGLNRTKASPHQSPSAKQPAATKAQDKKDTFKNDRKTKAEAKEFAWLVEVQEGDKLTDKEGVASYLYRFKKLPRNFITKNQARKKGWLAEKGNLWKVTDKMSIGGDKFGNREGLLPQKQGRKYFEADIDYQGGRRGAKRIIYSNDGLIFYTHDHYNSFEPLIGEEDI